MSSARPSHFRSLAAVAGGLALPLITATALNAQTRAGGGPGPAVGFGSAVAVAGEQILIGRPGEATLLPMPAGRPGGVHVFQRSEEGSEWIERQLLSPEGVGAGDAFGQTLAVQEGRLAVGAPKEADGRGAVHLFERDAAGDWRWTARLEAPEGAPGDQLGFALVLEGDLVLAGAPGSDGERGAVHLFRRDAASGSWTAAGRLTGSGSEPGSRFGAALAVQGSRAVVGAPGPHVAPSILGLAEKPRPGAGYIFRFVDGRWQEEDRLAVQESGGLALGFAVLLHGAEAFLSAPVAQKAAGVLFRFVRDEASGRWRAAGRLTAADPKPQAFFGAALAWAGEDLLVGAPLAAQLAGEVHVLRRDGASGWRDAQRLTVRARGFGALLGSALAAGRDLAVAGAPNAALFDGVGYIYARDAASGRWSRTGSVMGEAPALEPVVGGEVECEEGAARDFTCEGVNLVSFLPLPRLGGARGVMVNDVWGWTDPETGKEYALVGRTDGTAFLDVSDPARPLYVGELPLTDGAVPNLWRDIKVYANHAFIVSDGAGPHGMQVFDLARLREVRQPPVTFTEDAHYDRIHSAHNLVIDEETGFAYVVGASMGGETCGGALHMVDIRDPEHPTFAGCYADPSTGNAKTGYTHDAQCVVYRGPDAAHVGKEICFNSSETALGIADVTDKAHPVSLAVATYPNVGYAHQGWLSEDHRYFFLDDEEDEVAGSVPRTRTLVWDVQDLDDPVLAAEYLGQTEASDHNLYVRGRYMYQSNYVSGLRILDIADPTHPVEVGYFDTVPWGNDTPGFAGSWSNYPFFESGVIVVTSMREGVFLLKKREPRAVS
ncbi:MAG: choice-of-anchor B family protein [Gemmatimonadota bacterium]